MFYLHILCLKCTYKHFSRFLEPRYSLKYLHEFYFPNSLLHIFIYGHKHEKTFMLIRIDYRLLLQS